MATMNFSIPDEVRDKFNKAFEGKNKSAVIARLMLRAVEEEERQQRDESLLAQMRRMRNQSRGATREQIRRAREEGRH